MAYARGGIELTPDAARAATDSIRDLHARGVLAVVT
jgi:hypothetical protein